MDTVTADTCICPLKVVSTSPCPIARRLQQYPNARALEERRTLRRDGFQGWSAVDGSDFCEPRTMTGLKRESDIAGYRMMGLSYQGVFDALLILWVAHTIRRDVIYLICTIHAFQPLASDAPPILLLPPLQSRAPELSDDSIPLVHTVAPFTLSEDRRVSSVAYTAVPPLDEGYGINLGRRHNQVTL